MARTPFTVEMPATADPLITLSKNILTKHIADGAASPIPAATAALLTTKVAEAETQDALQKDRDQWKEKYIEERNLRLGTHITQSSITVNTILFFVTSIRNFLLGHHRGSERNLGEYGFTVNSPKGSVQVLVPRNAAKLIKLAKDILKKHTADAGDSILASFDMAALEILSDEAETRNVQASKASRDKEKATQARNNALGIAKGQNTKTAGTAAYTVRSIRDILLGFYRGREQNLGDWGFTVNFFIPPTPPAPPPA